MRTWVDGELRDDTEAVVSVFDHGLTVGDGAFETMKVVHGAAFALRRHLERLRRSAAGLGLTVPVDDGELRRIVGDVLAANRLDDGRLRITLTGGAGPLGSGRGNAGPTLIVAASQSAPWPATAAIVTVGWRRNEHAATVGLKTTSYADNVVALDHAHRHGASEAIMANTAGHLCEGTGTNVFVVLDDALLTPPLSSGCLAGVTRELVMELCPTQEADLPLDALTGAEEAFLTSSTRDVQPIALVDGHPLPAAPGPHTRAAMAAFADLQRRTLDP